MAKKPYRNRNGFILWQGPSKIDGKPIVAIATGFTRKTKNQKTGQMIQTWIERADKPAGEIRKAGEAGSICGADRNGFRPCPLFKACYVDVSKAPTQVSKSFLAGAYDPFPGHSGADPAPWRFGSHGDPAAVPVSVWRRVVSGLNSWTGYTHQWRRAGYLADFLMASVESAESKREARKAGFRTFRVIRPAEQLQKDEILCPASPEAGRKTDCSRCGLCKGNASSARNVAIVAHGAGLPRAWRR